MITAVLPRPASTTTSYQHKREPGHSSRKARRPDRILVAEHRDEVFARLAADLREMGYTVFRASRAVDVCRMYSYGQIELVLYNSDLPCEDAWLSARKFRMFDAYARVWVYVGQKEILNSETVDLTRIERTIYYQGDLFHLADQIAGHLRELSPWWSVTPKQSTAITRWPSRLNVNRLTSRK